MRRLAKQRPAEVATGPVLALAIFGFLTQTGVSQLPAAIAAAVCGFGPLVLSGVVDALRRR